MKLSYLKGTDNKIADALSRVRQKLDKETITELLNCARIGNTPRAESDNINVIQEGERVDQEIIVQHTHIVKQHKKFRNLANGGLGRGPRIGTRLFRWLRSGWTDRKTIRGSWRNSWVTEYQNTTRGSMLPDKRNS